MAKVTPVVGLNVVSVVNGSDLGHFGIHRLCAIIFVALFCFVPNIYHHPDRIVDKNFENLGKESYRVSLILTITMCCPMILDTINRISDEKKYLMDFKSLLLPFGLFTPNALILIFCMKPENASLFYSIILCQVVVLQALLLAVLRVQDIETFSDSIINCILYMRLASISSMVLYILTNHIMFGVAYFALVLLATVLFFRTLYIWVQKHFVYLYALLFHEKIEMYDKTEFEICDLHNSLVMTFLELSYLGFFVVPYDRTTSYNGMCYIQVIVVVLLTLLPGRMSRRHANMSLRALDAKKSFVQYISHEARGPLQIASLGLELLVSDMTAASSPSHGEGKEKVDEFSKSVDLNKKWLEDRIVHTREILDACNLATGTLNDMLTFDKLESGMLKLETEIVPAIKFFHSEFRAFSIHARIKNIKMDCDTDSQLHPFYNHMSLKCDKHKISQAFRNFVSNALKFTPKNGTISLRIKVMSVSHSNSAPNSSGKIVLDGLKEGSVLALDDSSLVVPNSISHSNGMSCSISKSNSGNVSNSFVDIEAPLNVPCVDKLFCRVEVSDTGPGISAANRSKLFQKYTQFDAGVLQQGGGSGLGLFLTKNIVELNGGFVGATSDGVPGKGCIFYMDLPIYSLDKDECVSIHDSAHETAIDTVVAPELPKMIKSKSGVYLTKNSKSSENPDRLPNDESQTQVNEFNPNELFIQTSNINLEKMLHMLPKTSQKTAPKFTLKNVKDNCVINVLIVDDSVINRKIIIRALSQIEFCTVLCTDVDNGQLAVDIIKQSNITDNKTNYNHPINNKYENIYFDILFIDSNMPIKNGEDTIREIRNMNYKGLIYGVTGSAENAFVDCGADEVYTKPLKLGILRNVVRGKKI